jgi:hypothetical protein
VETLQGVFVLGFFLIRRERPLSHIGGRDTGREEGGKGIDEYNECEARGRV